MATTMLILVHCLLLANLALSFQLQHQRHHQQVQQVQDTGLINQQLQYPFWAYLAWQPFLESNPTPYGLIPHGIPETSDFRLYFRDSQGPISPFHDIPLYVDAQGPNPVLRMVVEIPRWTNAKYEIANEEVLNPMRQPIKNGKLRFAPNMFPHHGYMWNYGAFPQTWENPHVLDEVTGFVGDNDPLDILEIGTRVAKVGDVIAIKVLGALGLVDQGETDWKILVIDVNDTLADQINSVCDIEKNFPGLIEATRHWLRNYKLADGGSANTFAANGEIQSAEFAHVVINRTHEHWKRLVKDPTVKTTHARFSVTQADSPFFLPRKAAVVFTVTTATTMDMPQDHPEKNSWHFLQKEVEQNCTATLELSPKNQ